jgi:hypothetical protein
LVRRHAGAGSGGMLLFGATVARHPANDKFSFKPIISEVIKSSITKFTAANK